jgi:hypothetical protein
MADDSVLMISLGVVFCFTSLLFCCHYLQIRSQLFMYQNLIEDYENRTQRYIVLPSAPPSVEVDPV